MTIDRDLWRPQWAEGEYPSLPCPTCGGPMNFDESSLSRKTSKHNSDLVDVAGIDEALSRFSGWFICGHAKCAEVLAVTGDCSYDNAYGPTGETITEQTLHPRSIHPGPPVISIGPEITTEIRSALEMSYQLLWANYDACASRLRVVLELILTDWGFPVETPEGKFVSLHHRILGWTARYGSSSVSQSLMAIKWLGNVSAHATNLPLERLLDAYEILERVLQQLFPPDPTRLDQLADEINKAKGQV